MAYIDTQTNKIRNLLQLLFLAIDIEFAELPGNMLAQFKTARAELGEFKTLKTIDVEISPKNDKAFLHPDNHKNTNNRFKFFLYKKAEQLFQNNQLTVKEKINNRSLYASLIQAKD
jgi:hypothetical protein